MSAPTPDLPELVLAGSVSTRADVLVIGVTSSDGTPEILAGDARSTRRSSANCSTPWSPWREGPRRGAHPRAGTRL
ncbi:hypothetical protein NJ76_01735, partial [Rhodococcus sp. IITR03]